jgi:ribosomal protein L37AE/L43A
MKKGYVFVTCTECGTEFERFRAQPYITICKKCRKKLRKSGHDVKETYKSKAVRKAEKKALEGSIKCPDCRRIVEQERRLGLHACPACKTQWWSMGIQLPGVYIDKTSTDDLTYEGNVKLGPWLEVFQRLEKKDGKYVPKQ